MELMFRALSTGEMERPPTQRDQFNNDDVELAEALVRESLQNSLDAKCSEQVHVRFRLHQPNATQLQALRPFLQLDQLEPHLRACDIDPISDSNLRLLIIEDFGATGLTGSWSTWDNEPFCDFWRRMGLSHKGGRSLGRWGLGKLVFSGVSKIRIFFGLTVPENAPQTPLLMGQAVLTHHKLPDGTRYDSHGFFGVQGSDGLQLPVTDPTVIHEFRAACDVQRQQEPGLSVVIPFPESSVTSDGIATFVVRNYFFPILLGQLKVTIDDLEINANSFVTLAKKIGGPRFSEGKLAEFIQAIESTRRGDTVTPTLLGPTWPKDIESALGQETLAALRQRLVEGQLVYLRAPILLKKKNGEERSVSFDLFFIRAPADQFEVLFVRDSITLPGEARYFRGRGVYAALVAQDPDLCAFLGDAENPSHTSWSTTAEKLKKNWSNPPAKLKEIREALQRAYNTLTSALETLDNEALASFFSVQSDEPGKKPKPPGPIVRPPVIVVPPPPPRTFRVTRRIGGFSVSPGPALSAENLPLSLRIRVAYDVRSGNPFTKHRPYDFDLTKNTISVSLNGGNLTRTAANTLDLEITAATFDLAVAGFDINRDLIVDARTLE